MRNEVAKNEPAQIDRTSLEALLKRADDGDESAAPDIRKLLDQAPRLVNPLGGDLARNAERALVRAIVGKNVGQREAIYRKMKQLRSELAGPNPQPLERLLVERVVLCWLHVHHADCQYGQATKITLEYGEYLQCQQDRAQRRYLAAIKCLATVRRLALPIKVDVTVAATVESPTGPTCRRTNEVGHVGESRPGHGLIGRKTVNSDGRTRSQR